MATWDDIVLIASALPAVEQDEDRLLVDGTPFAELVDPNHVILSCPHDEKIAHLESESEIFSTDDRIRDLNAVIVDLEVIDVTTLQEAVVEAWMCEAPDNVREGYED